MCAGEDDNLCTCEHRAMASVQEIQRRHILDAMMAVLQVHLKDLQLIDRYTEKVSPGVDATTVKGKLAYLYRRMLDTCTLDDCTERPKRPP